MAAIRHSFRNFCSNKQVIQSCKSICKEVKVKIANKNVDVLPASDIANKKPLQIMLQQQLSSLKGRISDINSGNVINNHIKYLNDNFNKINRITRKSRKPTKLLATLMKYQTTKIESVLKHTKYNNKYFKTLLRMVDNQKGNNQVKSLVAKTKKQENSIDVVELLKEMITKRIATLHNNIKEKNIFFGYLQKRKYHWRINYFNNVSKNEYHDDGKISDKDTSAPTIKDNNSEGNSLVGTANNYNDKQLGVYKAIVEATKSKVVVQGCRGINNEDINSRLKYDSINEDNIFKNIELTDNDLFLNVDTANSVQRQVRKQNNSYLDYIKKQRNCIESLLKNKNYNSKGKGVVHSQSNKKHYLKLDEFMSPLNPMSDNSIKNLKKNKTKINIISENMHKFNVCNNNDKVRVIEHDLETSKKRVKYNSENITLGLSNSFSKSKTDNTNYILPENTKLAIVNTVDSSSTNSDCSMISGDDLLKKGQNDMMITDNDCIKYSRHERQKSPEKQLKLIQEWPRDDIVVDLNNEPMKIDGDLELSFDVHLRNKQADNVMERKPQKFAIITNDNKMKTMCPTEDVIKKNLSPEESKWQHPNENIPIQYHTPITEQYNFNDIIDKSSKLKELSIKQNNNSYNGYNNIPKISNYFNKKIFDYNRNKEKTKLTTNVNVELENTKSLMSVENDMTNECIVDNDVKWEPKTHVKAILKELNDNKTLTPATPKIVETQKTQSSSILNNFYSFKPYLKSNYMDDKINRMMSLVGQSMVNRSHQISPEISAKFSTNNSPTMLESQNNEIYRKDNTGTRNTRIKSPVLNEKCFKNKNFFHHNKQNGFLKKESNETNKTISKIFLAYKPMKHNLIDKKVNISGVIKNSNMDRSKYNWPTHPLKLKQPKGLLNKPYNILSNRKILNSFKVFHDRITQENARQYDNRQVLKRDSYITTPKETLRSVN